MTTVAQLKLQAKMRGLKNYSKLKKDQLIKLLGQSPVPVAKPRKVPPKRVGSLPSSFGPRFDTLPPELKEKIILEADTKTRLSYCNSSKQMQEMCRKRNLFPENLVKKWTKYVIEESGLYPIESITKNGKTEWVRREYTGPEIFWGDPKLSKNENTKILEKLVGIVLRTFGKKKNQKNI